MEKDGFKFLRSTSSRMAVPDPLCCHFALAKNLAEKKMPCGVEARDKLLMEAIEAKKEGIFGEQEGRLVAETDKEKKNLTAVLKSVKTEVENLKQGCDLHGFWRLEIVRKSSGIIGGIFRIEDTMFTFVVDKKKKKKNQVEITVEKSCGAEEKPNAGNIRKQFPIFCTVMGAQLQQGAKSFDFTFPLRCAACRGGGKKARLEHCQKIFQNQTIAKSGKWLSPGS